MDGLKKEKILEKQIIEKITQLAIQTHDTYLMDLVKSKDGINMRALLDWLESQDT